MANSIAFSVGSGNSGGVIKSIQRGKSPVMQLRTHYKISGNVYSPDRKYVITNPVSIDPYTVTIDAINPDKSIILLTPDLTIKSHVQTGSSSNCDYQAIGILSVDPTVFQIGFMVNIDSIVLSLRSSTINISHAEKKEGNANIPEVSISTEEFFAPSCDISNYLVSIGRDPYSEGVLTSGNTPSTEIITIPSITMVSWQVVEFY